MNSWKDCKKILCIRPDNMGDLLMTVPALRALKESFQAEITVLVSSMAAGVVPFIPEIDKVIVCDVPWVKAKKTTGAGDFMAMAEKLRSEQFDAAVIFTVYSQNPMPSIMLAWLAGIPRRLSYCRENPYELLTDWVPDKEPYTEIKHQVRRDMDLVKAVGAHSLNERLALNIPEDPWPVLYDKLGNYGLNPDVPWMILHPGVSEKKREYPVNLWIEAGRELASNYQLLITGGPGEKALTDTLAEGIGDSAVSLAGTLSIAEFMLLIKKSSLVISVNTGTVHLAAAAQTPVIVLYALTNPQHFPWKAVGRVFTFPLSEGLYSKNEVICFANEKYLFSSHHMTHPAEIVDAVKEVLSGKADIVPELPF